MANKSFGTRRILSGLVLGGGLAWLGLRSTELPPKVEPKSPAVVPNELPAGMVVMNDSVKIFQKAFWRSPNADDQILHAERREWVGEDGVGKWQWFIVVQASPELMKYVREDNAFGLVLAKPAVRADGAPAWFDYPTAEVDVLHSPTTNLRFIFSKSGSLLYATDSGRAFRPGTPEKPKPGIEPVVSAGRLPTTPPPAPVIR